MDSPSDLSTEGNDESVSRLREYVREYKLQRGEHFVDVDDTNKAKAPTDKHKQQANSSTRTADDTDSVIPLKEYVLDYDLDRGEEFVDDVDAAKDNDAKSFTGVDDDATTTTSTSKTAADDVDIDSVTRLREYVQDYQLQRGENVVEVNETSSDGSVKSASASTPRGSPFPIPLSSNPKSTTDNNTKTSNKDMLNLSKRYFMDNKSISSLSSASTNDDDYGLSDYVVSYANIHRPSFFIESSKASLSSDDDEEDPLPASNLMELVLASQELGDDLIYDDWDSGLSHSSIEFNEDDDDNNDDSWARDSNLAPGGVLETGLDFPHRALHYKECQICFEMEYLRRRVCCDFQICNKCLITYLSGKVVDGKVQIECPNDRCNALMHRDEIRHRLPIDLREKFSRFLIDANKDPYKKTCPSCSLPFEIDPARLNVSKKKLKHGVEVTCTKCRLVWCFRCQAPFHSDMTCKKYRNEDEMVRRWAKGKALDGQANAQKCPKCKIFVQKRDGCDHMKCTQCDTNFCYKCGDRYISVKFFGSHWNRFSLFGCKYRLMPEKNGLRRLIRGSHFVGRVLAAVIFAGLGLAAGAVLVAGSVVILPGYGILRLKRRMWAAKQRKKFDRKMRWKTEAVKAQELAEKKIRGGNNLETVVEESETETLEQTPDDPQQIQVIVHQHEEDTLFADGTDHNQDGGGDIIVNKYADEDADYSNSKPQLRQTTMEGGGALSIEEEEDGGVLVLNVTDLKDVTLDGKHKKIIVNLVSSLKKEEGNDETVEDNVDSGVICNDSPDVEEGIDVKFEQQECASSRNLSEVTRSCEICVLNSEEEKQFRDEESLQCHSDSGDNADETIHRDAEVTVHIEINNSADVQNNHSVSKGSSNLRDKIITKSKVFKSDTDNNKNNSTTPLKLDSTENAGKGCFGNIFNVSKRTNISPPITVVASNEENTIKSNKDHRTNAVNIKKAGTWEKCRSSKVEIDSSWMHNSTSSCVDSDNLDINSRTNNNATPPLPVLKSSSSLSSVHRYIDDVAGRDKIEDKDASLSMSKNSPVKRGSECDNVVAVSRSDLCVERESVNIFGSTTGLGVSVCDTDEDAAEGGVSCHDLSFDQDTNHICQISMLTHL